MPRKVAFSGKAKKQQLQAKKARNHYGNIYNFNSVI